jgi:hypothetical protein
MFSRKAETSLPTFDVPAPASDHPSWVKVGVIAAVGFAIGIAWPRLAGLKLGPQPPEAPHASVAAKTSAEPAASDAPPLPTATAVTAPPLPTATASSNAPAVTMGKAFVLSCKTKDGETLKGHACAMPGGFDALAQPRLTKLAQCPAADGVSGKLAVVLTVDFGSSHINVDPGKATTIPASDGLIACVRASFQGAGLGGIEHEHARYTLLYNVMLAAPKGGDGANAPPAASADSKDGVSAQVVWETALIRDQPKNGQVVARLARGTHVKVGPLKEGWYPVKYGQDFGSEGWVYRGAIGK